MKFTTLSLLTAAIVGTTISASATVIYQDTFDNDGIATNAGVGGGMLTASDNGATLHSDNGDLVASTNFGSHQSVAWTANQFDLTGGFELDVEFTTVSAGNPSFTYSFVIIDEVATTSGSTTELDNLNGLVFNDNDNNFVGFGAALRPTHSTAKDPGIYTDFGTNTLVSTTLTGVNLGTSQTLNLTVNADGSGSATLDGTTENFAAGTFSSLFTDSLDGEFHFAVYAQGNNDPGSSLQSVTITQIPEPGSLALLGLGGLLIVRRRR